MKKLVNQLFVLLFVITSVGCNKTEVARVEVEKDPAQYVLPVLHIGSGEQSKGILVGSKKDLLDIAKSKDFVEVKSGSNVNKVFVPTTGTIRPEPKDPKDPSKENKICWDYIFAQYDTVYPEILAVANSQCKDIFICITCPNLGLSALMVVSPTSFKCFEIMDAEMQLDVFNISGGYDGGKVTNFINQLHNKR